MINLHYMYTDHNASAISRWRLKILIAALMKADFYIFQVLLFHENKID